jgi:hypothetical protein
VPGCADDADEALALVLELDELDEPHAPTSTTNAISAAAPTTRDCLPKPPIMHHSYCRSVRATPR